MIILDSNPKPNDKLQIRNVSYLHEQQELDLGGVTVVFSSFSSDFVGLVVASPKAPLGAGLTASGSGFEVDDGSVKSRGGSSVRGNVDLCLSSASFAPPARSKISSTSRTLASASLFEKSAPSSINELLCLSARDSSSSLSCWKIYEGVVELIFIWSSIVKNNFTPLYKINFYKNGVFSTWMSEKIYFSNFTSEIRQVRHGPKTQKRNCLTRRLVRGSICKFSKLFYWLNSENGGSATPKHLVACTVTRLIRGGIWTFVGISLGERWKRAGTPRPHAFSSWAKMWKWHFKQF